MAVSCFVFVGAVCAENRFSTPCCTLENKRCSTHPVVVLACAAVEHCGTELQNPGALLFVIQVMLKPVVVGADQAQDDSVRLHPDRTESERDASDSDVAVVHCYADPGCCIDNVAHCVADVA